METEHHDFSCEIFDKEFFRYEKHFYSAFWQSSEDHTLNPTWSWGAYWPPTPEKFPECRIEEWESPRFFWLFKKFSCAHSERKISTLTLSGDPVEQFCERWVKNLSQEWGGQYGPHMPFEPQNLSNMGWKGAFIQNRNTYNHFIWFPYQLILSFPKMFTLFQGCSILGAHEWWRPSWLTQL